VNRVIIKDDSKAANFINKVIANKDKIRKQIKAGEPLSNLKDKGIKFVQPL